MFPLALRAARSWRPARWGVAAGAAVLTVLAVGLPTAVIPNQLFARSVATPWWGYPVLAFTAVLAGMLLATYVRTGIRTDGGEEAHAPGERRASRLGTVGGLLSFFAVGCPVCNKLVLLVLGTSGALSVWQPLQPVLAVASLALLAFAVVRRLAGEVACPVTA
ncbi:hypothetical protein [Streptomyces iconiensis]|uniref:Integral membrane protein n=1 Tax=Streptomyces iconiensis TaxID=1384038 RepID=A0ABT7A101_9ACTN|nr:hypothetical protein [Streptomyces iconiensis]MDJ1134739.1 hypothetical protein [Streptomyces iconiensis]